MDEHIEEGKVIKRLEL
ncbi:hypothetical protein DESHY_110441 [Desulforamulus hydrothermalis Lam5 = DSM 18033]|uniref:Uncharacterized protein n=1 Tax=Desulforamulus hydrothermalis Lam5 = DSM 18033 TaxID=1121428 RepID=K8DXQ5_9FIRM|nr:hypothetical protein DESHY_110441 [Desulforamulus hydrothermalis Lam5 = DSM 18033]